MLEVHLLAHWNNSARIIERTVTKWKKGSKNNVETSLVALEGSRILDRMTTNVGSVELIRGTLDVSSSTTVVKHCVLLVAIGSISKITDSCRINVTSSSSFVAVSMRKWVENDTSRLFIGETSSVESTKPGNSEQSSWRIAMSNTLS